MRTKNWQTSFTLYKKELAILEEQITRTGKNRSEILGELIDEIEKRQQSQNKEEVV